MISDWHGITERLQLLSSHSGHHLEQKYNTNPFDVALLL